MTELPAKVEALRANSPPLLLRAPEAAIFKVSVANTIRVDLSRLHGVDAADIARMAREARAQR